MAGGERKVVRFRVPDLVVVPRKRYQRRHRTIERVGKGVLFVAGAGAVVALLANLDDLKSSKEAKAHWWLVPLAVLAIGYLLRKRGNPYASAVLAVGGALFAIAYAAQSKAAQAQQAPQLPPPPAPKPLQVQQQQKPKGNVQGPSDTGAPLAFLPPGVPAAWVQMPNGQLVRVPIMAQPRALPKPFTG